MGYDWRREDGIRRGKMKSHHTAGIRGKVHTSLCKQLIKAACFLTLTHWPTGCLSGPHFSEQYKAVPLICFFQFANIPEKTLLSSRKPVWVKAFCVCRFLGQLWGDWVSDWWWESVPFPFVSSNWPGGAWWQFNIFYCYFICNFLPSLWFLSGLCISTH